MKTRMFNLQEKAKKKGKATKNYKRGKRELIAHSHTQKKNK